MKVVINTTFGGFGISEKGFRYMIKLGAVVQVKDQPANPDAIIGYNPSAKGDDWDPKYSDRNIVRSDPLLAKMVEDLGKESSDGMSDLMVVELPDGMPYTIDSYDGSESIEPDFYKMLNSAKVTLMRNAQVPEIKMLFDALKYIDKDD